MEEPRMMLDDVFLLAQSIAEEFELVAQYHNIDDFRIAIEKVIHSLEALASAVKENEVLKTKLGNAVSDIILLSSMKESYSQERTQLKQSYEEAEELWLIEISNLKSQLSSLKSENEILKLGKSIEKEAGQDERFKDTINDLESGIYKLQLSLQQKEKHLHNLIKNEIILNEQILELTEINKKLCLKNVEVQENIIRLMVEKNNFQNESKESTLLSENSNGTDIYPKGESNSEYSLFCEESLRQEIKHHINIELELLEKVKKLQSELHQETCNFEKYEEGLAKSAHGKKHDLEHSKISQLFHLFLGLFPIFEYC